MGNNSIGSTSELSVQSNTKQVLGQYLHRYRHVSVYVLLYIFTIYYSSVGRSLASKPGRCWLRCGISLCASNMCVCACLGVCVCVCLLANRSRSSGVKIRGQEHSSNVYGKPHHTTWCHRPDSTNRGQRIIRFNSEQPKRSALIRGSGGK